MTPASSGLVPQMSKIRCSETWAWVEGNFVFHLFSSSFLKYVAFVKTNSEKNETKKQTKTSWDSGVAFLHKILEYLCLIPNDIFQRM